jgi:hypothetical protein
MLIDAYDDTWFDCLGARLVALPSGQGLYLLIDGAFVPGLHRQVKLERKAFLFESLPGCNASTKDVSPFLVPFEGADKQMRALLERCERWPMVSVIGTTEPMEALARRLAAWCIVEADGQRFNFRFADARRLPAIFRTLNALQRAQLAGPAVRWSYVTSAGGWDELAVDASASDIATDPELDSRQFAALVDDSRIDELLSLLRDRGCDVYGHPSRSHALLAEALGAAVKAGLDDLELLAWCEWFWRRDQLSRDDTAEALAAWSKKSILEGESNG